MEQCCTTTLEMDAFLFMLNTQCTSPEEQFNSSSVVKHTNDVNHTMYFNSMPLNLDFVEIS
jgi:hypothetical protein